MKKLVLSYELSWRTKQDIEFLKSDEWRKIRFKILTRDHFACAYCGLRSEKGMHVNHVDGNPKNNCNENLEVICPDCHMINHSGLWCAVRQVIDCYSESNYSQNDIARLTREMRSTGKDDVEIIEFLGLKNKVEWKQDLHYLARLFGFITSRAPVFEAVRPVLTDREQKQALLDRWNW